MFNKELVIKAHKLAKETKKEFPIVNYQFQFGLEMKYLLSNLEEVKKVMIELTGSLKQIAWAEEIRSEKAKDWEKSKAFYQEKKDFNKKKLAELIAAAERIFSIENASNWIDLRNHSIISLANADMKKRLNRYCFDIGEEKAFANRY